MASAAGKHLKYHFVSETVEGIPILEFDTNLEPPQPNEMIRLQASPGQDEITYRITDVFFSPESQERIKFFIVVEPMPLK